MPEPAVQAGFKVMIDNCPLGTFAKCEGLKASYSVKTYEEGGQNGYVHQMPGRLSYENITLTRAVNNESIGLATWFASYQSMVKRSTGRISVLDTAGEEVIAWSLMGVFPVSWAAGAIEAGATGVLIETLVIAHEGFLDLSASVGGIGL